MTFPRVTAQLVLNVSLVGDLIYEMTCSSACISDVSCVYVGMEETTHTYHQTLLQRFVRVTGPLRQVPPLSPPPSTPTRLQ